jgi:hypothetical protein
MSVQVAALLSRLSDNQTDRNTALWAIREYIADKRYKERSDEEIIDRLERLESEVTSSLFHPLHTLSFRFAYVNALQAKPNTNMHPIFVTARRQCHLADPADMDMVNPDPSNTDNVQGLDCDFDPDYVDDYDDEFLPELEDLPPLFTSVPLKHRLSFSVPLVQTPTTELSVSYTVGWRRPSAMTQASKVENDVLPYSTYRPATTETRPTQKWTPTMYLSSLEHKLDSLDLSSTRMRVTSYGHASSVMSLRLLTPALSEMTSNPLGNSIESIQQSDMQTDQKVRSWLAGSVMQ